MKKLVKGRFGAMMLAAALAASASAAGLAGPAGIPAAAEEGTDWFRIDACDEAWGLNPSQGDERGRTYWEGTGAVRTYTGKYMTNSMGSLEKQLSVGPTGLTEQNAALGMWLYINDLQHITGDAAIEITSSGVCDVDEYQWRFSDLIASDCLRSGWNWLELRTSEAVKAGNPNLDGINFIRIYYFGTNVGAMLDDVILYNADTYAPTEDVNFTRALPAAPNNRADSVLIDSCDSGFGTPDPDNKTEGAASASWTGSGSQIMDHVLPAPVDTKSDVYRADLEFDLYIDDVASIATDSGAYNAIEVSSGGMCDVDEYEFDLTALVLTGKIASGWNHVRIPFAATQLFAGDNDMINKTTGTPDLSAINYVRLMTNGTDRTVKLDNVRVTDRDYTGEEPEPEPEPEPTGDFFRISDGDTAWGMNPSQRDKLYSTYWEGDGAVRSYTGKNSFDNSLSMETTYDLGVTGLTEENAALGMWLYLNDTQSVNREKDSMIEISSGGTFDQNEYEWDLNAMIADGRLVSGWNWLELNVSDAKKTGEPDLDGMNYIRLYTNGTNLLAMVDDVILFDRSAYVPTEDEDYVRVLPASDADAPDFTVLDDCDNAWDGTQADKENAQQGKGCITASGTNINISKTFAPVDTGLTMHEAVLDFWLYIDNAAAIATDSNAYNAIEVSSSGTFDQNEVELNLTTLFIDGRIKDGWNHVSIPFAAALAFQNDNDMINKTTGTPDLSALNYVRLMTNGGEHTVKLDCISVRRASYTGEITVPVSSVLLDAGTEQGVWKADRLEYRYGGQSVAATGNALTYEKADLAVGATDLDGCFGVSLWVYADSAESISSFTVSLRDGAGKTAVWTVSGLANGWNWLALRYAQAQVAQDFDADAIASFAIAIEATQDVTVRLNRVSLINDLLGQNLAEPADKVIPPQFDDEKEDDDQGEGGNDYDVETPEGPAPDEKDLTGAIVASVIGGVVLLGAAAWLVVVLVRKKKNR